MISKEFKQQNTIFCKKKIEFTSQNNKLVEGQ